MVDALDNAAWAIQEAFHGGTATEESLRSRL
jgi:hypothetical protein